MLVELSCKKSVCGQKMKCFRWLRATNYLWKILDSKIIVHFLFGNHFQRRKYWGKKVKIVLIFLNEDAIIYLRYHYIHYKYTPIYIISDSDRLLKYIWFSIESMSIYQIFVGRCLRPKNPEKKASSERNYSLVDKKNSNPTGIRHKLSNLV